MKNLALLLVIFAALAFSGCPGNTETANEGNAGNSGGTETEKPAEDANAAITEVETKAYDAWKNKDAAYFESMLADNFVSSGAYTDKAGLVKWIKDSPCEVKEFKLEDPKLMKLTDDAAIMTHKFSGDYTCDGKQGASPEWVVSLFVKQGDTWKGAFHDSIVAEGAKGESAPPAKAGDGASADDELTKALSAMETKWWEEWKEKKSDYFVANSRDDFLFLGSDGRTDKATSLQNMKDKPCEVKSFALKGFKATKLTDNVAVLTYNATQDAVCDGKASSPKLFSSSVFVKDGDNWKGAFYMEKPAG